MADLFQRAKAEFPDYSDEEINKGLQSVKSSLGPSATDDEVLNTAKKAIELGSSESKLGQSYSPEARAKLVETKNKAAAGPDWAAGIAAFGAGLQGKDAMGAGRQVLGIQEAKRAQPLQDFDITRANLQARISELREGKDRDIKDKEESNLNRLDSEETILAQTLAKKLLPTKDFSKMTAAQINKSLPNLSKLYEIEQKKLDRAESRAATTAAKEAAKMEKSAQVLEKDVQKLSDKLGNAQELSNALDNVNAKLGFNLDEAEIKDGILKVKGKEVDLPGVSIPAYGRVAFWEGARELESAVAKVFNTELKDRSGAAVTTPELERLKIEFGSGKFNSESDLVQALKDYKLMVAKELKNREAGFRPEVVETYKERGGATSDKVTPKTKTEVSRQYSPSRNKTLVKYSDGTEEVLDGKQQ